MLNALLLAAALTTTPVLLAPNHAAPPPPALDWSLEGRFGFNEDGEIAAGLTLVPDEEFPLGIWVQFERLEWENTSTDYHVSFFKDRRPVAFPPQVRTTEMDDLKWSAGISWRFN